MNQQPIVVMDSPAPKGCAPPLPTPREFERLYDRSGQWQTEWLEEQFALSGGQPTRQLRRLYQRRAYRGAYAAIGETPLDGNHWQRRVSSARELAEAKRAVRQAREAKAKWDRICAEREARQWRRKRREARQQREQMRKEAA